MADPAKGGEPNEQRVTRCDFVSAFDKFERTPQGFIKIPARLHSAGVFTYRRADGSITRELRLPEDLSSQTTLDSLAGAPVAKLHPPDPITPDNVSAYSKGRVSDAVRNDGVKFSEGDIIAQSSDLIADVESGKLREISPGFTCTIEPQQGVYQGQRYDAIQRNIIYNHIALGPKGWGRSGPEVSLRMDAQEILADAPEEKLKVSKDINTNTTIRLDGVDVMVAPEAATVIQNAFSKMGEKVEQYRKDAEKMEAERDTLKEKLAEASDEKKLQTRIDARVSLERAAASVLPEDFDFRGKTDRQIQEAAIKTRNDSLDVSNRSDEYVAARFDALLEMRNDGGWDQLRNAGAGKPPGQTYEAQKAHREMVEAQETAWQKPVSLGLVK